MHTLAQQALGGRVPNLFDTSLPRCSVRSLRRDGPHFALAPGSAYNGLLTLTLGATYARLISYRYRSRRSRTSHQP